MKREYIFCSLAIIVAIPILLNIILGANNPFQNIAVVGDSTHWLGFYGSYIGGILATIIGIFTIYCQSKHNALNIMIQEQRNYIEKLNLELADLVSSVEFWYLGSVSLKLYVLESETSDAFDKLLKIRDEYLDKLNELHRLATNKGNQWELTYAHRECTFVKDVQQEFLLCYRQYADDINALTKILARIDTATNIKELKNQVSQFNTDIDSHTKQFQQPLYDCAKSWIAYEENKLKLLRTEQKKLLPNLDVVK